MSLISIYQVLPRLFGNRNTTPKFNGSREENGCGKMSDFTPDILLKIKDMGFTHIWYTGLIEHARCTDDSAFGIPAGNPHIIKGKAGSPYAITDYYDIDPDLADSIPNRLAEFADLVDRTHNASLKFIIDFVPNHVARQYHSDIKPDTDFGLHDCKEWHFSPLNDFYYTAKPLHMPQNAGTIVDYQAPEYQENPARATGNDQFSAYPSIDDWYETVKLNYGIDYMNNQRRQFSPQPVLWQKMVDILLYWAQKGVDAFRCDMAEMVPVEFWQFAINKVKSQYPDIQFIAEVYNPIMYRDYIFRGGFDYLYDKVGLYDTLRAITCYGTPAYNITEVWKNLEGINNKMLRFLENHDEQRIASRFFAGNAERAIPAMLVTATFNQGAVMVYFGQEVGEPADGESGYSGDDGRTTIFDYYNVPQIQKWYNNGKTDGALLTATEQYLRDSYLSIIRLATTEKCFTDGEFYDLMWANTNIDNSKIYAYLRHINGEAMLVIANFDANNSHNIKLHIPTHAWQTMGFSTNTEVELTSIYGDNQKIIQTTESIADAGIFINMQPTSGVVYKILNKME